MKNLSNLCNQASNVWQRTLKTLFLMLLGAYRTVGTGHLGGSCRFSPSCSEYAVECVHSHSPWVALKLIFMRIIKCRPGGPFGYDPVPEVKYEQ